MDKPKHSPKLEVRQLSKSFGGVQVTQNVSFSVAVGERRILLGPNGAGKTTLFNLLVGAIKPCSGDIVLDGISITKLSMSQRARAGMARSYQKNNIFPDLSVHENLLLAAATGLGKTTSLMRDSFADKRVRRTAQEVAERILVTDVLTLAARHTSYGVRRQLEIGIALAANPRILLLDEPTSGIGPHMVERFYRIFAQLPSDISIIVIEHDLDLAFRIADSVTVLNFGQVIFDGSPQEARASADVRHVYLGDWVDTHA